VPHASFLSHAEYVDETHVALSYQFFNRTRANLQATGRAALMVECPYSGARPVMQLRYVRTETSGPIFERLRAKLAGIAAHTGMEKVFRLLGADVFEVQGIVRCDTAEGPPGPPARCDVAEGARAVAAELAEVSELARLVPVFMDGLRQRLHIDHAILWLLDAQRESLATLASLGYAHSGVGSELPLADAGLAGVALRIGTPIRIGHMASAYRYGMAWRERAEGVGLQAVIARAIPLPGLERPCSQLAVPLRARGRSIGVLLVESAIELQQHSYDDEDALMLLGAQLAQAMAALHADELLADTAAAPAAAVAQGAPLCVRHHARDHSVFVGDDYLIKGVAGAILAKLVRDQIATGRDGFSTRELRLAGGDLRLPEVQDNLGVRLLLLERRLAERDVGLRIERTGRGQYRLVARGPLELLSG
jgi:adenylate cyclase